MEYYNNTLCISGTELLDGIVTKTNYDRLCQRGWAKVIRRAKLGQPALIELSSLPLRFREKITAKYGNPEKKAKTEPFKESITPDADAITFFSSYLLSDGRNLPESIQREYAMNAAVLNTIHETRVDMFNIRQAQSASTRGFWPAVLVVTNNLRAEFKHNLPANERALQRKYERYIANGVRNYDSLISGKYCNDNSRKVTHSLENLLMSLYSMPNKPFAANVHTLYHQFIAGIIQVADQKTGEIFDPKNFMRNGKAIEISEKTVWNYLNMPDNNMIVLKARSGTHRYNSTTRPHHHRHAPIFSFSKITMDDRDLPRKCINGKWVKAYYAYDVTSGCVIGSAYSLTKDEELFLDCTRSIFRLIEREGFSMPMEVEVENHLVRKFFDDLHAMFPFVRICNPGNSQEKHAEHFNRAKKYGVEKNTQNGIGRWWSKHEAYTVDRDKANDEFVEKTYTYERLVADDIAANQDYNNQLHPKQKRYPGKTRWEVLVENMNPNAPQVSKAAVYKAIGEKTQTTIRRNQYVTVQHAKYQISGLAVLDRLLPNDYSVEAYYLPDLDGVIGEVFLYQAGTYLCKAEKIIEYNTAKSEWTEKDTAAYKKQSEYVAKFDSTAKKGKQELSSPVIIKTEVINEAIEQQAEIVEVKLLKEESIEDLLNDYDADEYTKKALKNL